MGEKLIGSRVPTVSEPTSDVGVSSHRVEHLIEQLRQRTAELEEANRELRRVSHYRSLFLARMSHELRTPLTSILGFTEILLDQEQLSETQRRFCQKIQDSGLQLQTSLNQLVDLSRVEAGQTELFFREFSLRETLRDSCAAVARFAHKQQVTVVYDLSTKITTVVTDEGKLRQVLYNFLAWAVGRSTEGQKVSMYADLPEASLLRICIEDDGGSISDFSSVFDPQEKPGTPEPDVDGLGIIIGRRLIDLMSGRVIMQNREFGGLRVLIEMPSRPAKE